MKRVLFVLLLGVTGCQNCAGDPTPAPPPPAQPGAQSSGRPKVTQPRIHKLVEDMTPGPVDAGTSD